MIRSFHRRDRRRRDDRWVGEREARWGRERKEGEDLVQLSLSFRSMIFNDHWVTRRKIEREREKEREREREG